MKKAEIEKKVADLMAAYRVEQKKLEGKYMKELRDICVPYAKSIAKHNVGDSVEDIIVERIGAKVVKGEVRCVYSGHTAEGSVREIME